MMPNPQQFDAHKPFIFTLKEGDHLFNAILQCADAIKLKSGIITGLGALRDITIGFYNRATCQHHSKLFSGDYEITSLTGNVTFAESDRFIHIHAALGDENFHVFGGHIISAYASAATEISIIPLTYEIHRNYNPSLGIKIICPLTFEV